MKNTILSLALVMASFGASAGVIGFDDLPGDETEVLANGYQGFGWDLTIIDGLHWLGVALIMGAIIGWFGV